MPRVGRVALGGDRGRSGVRPAGDGGPLRPGPRPALVDWTHPDDQPARRLDDPGDGGGADRAAGDHPGGTAPGPGGAAACGRGRNDDAPGPAWDWAGMVLGFLLLLGPLLAVRGFHPMAPLGRLDGRWASASAVLIVRPTPAWRQESPRRGRDRDRRAGPARAHAVARGAVDRSGRWRHGPTAPLPNLLWIVLDTLRADRMSVYGYDRPTTPALEAWAKAGITFDMARSTAPWTLPSHVSMFTGLWPSEHGACVDRSYHRDSPTLAEHLQAQGYAHGGHRRQRADVQHRLRRGTRVRPLRRLSLAGRGQPQGGAEQFRARDRSCWRWPGGWDYRPPTSYPYDYRQPASEITAKGRHWLDSLGPTGPIGAGALGRRSSSS